jgi:hypothetical protein
LGGGALSAEHPSDTDATVGLMDRGLLGHGLAEHGSLVVMAASSPAGRTTTNMLKLHVVGSPVR